MRAGQDNNTFKESGLGHDEELMVAADGNKESTDRHQVVEKPTSGKKTSPTYSEPLFGCYS